MDAGRILLALALILAHIVQIVIPFIPGHLVPAAAGYYFGVWGLAVDWTGMMLGSFIAFWLARRFGESIVLRFVERSRYERFRKFMEDRGVLGLFVLFLLPGMPKDALCFVAGASGVRFRDFVAIVLFVRLPADSILVLMGAGLRMGFRGWYLGVTIAGALTFLLYFFLSRRLAQRWKM